MASLSSRSWMSWRFCSITFPRATEFCVGRDLTEELERRRNISIVLGRREDVCEGEDESRGSAMNEDDRRNTVFLYNSKSSAPFISPLILNVNSSFSSDIYSVGSHVHEFLENNNTQ
eukprot:m.230889 g.230889  ORF g.230889 m.230889 type:complete len:117 (+) comp13893_c0_seq1:69-419(+)